MKARRKKSSARVAPARKAAVTRKPSVVASAKRVPAARKTRSPVARSLGADCTIEHAPGLHAQLSKILAESARVTLDFSAVKRCDTAGLQVLAAFIRERREAGREVELAGVSDNFLSTVKLLGLSALFGGDASLGQVGHA